jgi:hypothetical protein
MSLRHSQCSGWSMCCSRSTSMWLDRGTVARCSNERHLHTADDDVGVEVDSSVVVPNINLFGNEAMVATICGFWLLVCMGFCRPLVLTPEADRSQTKSRPRRLNPPRKMLANHEGIPSNADPVAVSRTLQLRSDVLESGMSRISHIQGGSRRRQLQQIEPSPSSPTVNDRPLQTAANPPSSTPDIHQIRLS